MDPSDNRTEQVLIDYTNHRGERAFRQIAPSDTSLRFGSNEWHPDRQWLLYAYDVGKDAVRAFAVAGIHRWGMPGMKMTADVSIARQLQNSMELNARMKNRIKLLLGHAGPDMMESFISGLQKILADEDPVDGII